MSLEPTDPRLLRRALAGSRLPERQAEVWADFELARRRSDPPGKGDGRGTRELYVHVYIICIYLSAYT